MKIAAFGDLIGDVLIILALTTPVLLRSTQSGDEYVQVMPKPAYISILSGQGAQDMSLVDRIVNVDSWVCGGGCYKSYPTTFRPSRSRKCQMCYCDKMCHFYRDCCPGVSLKHNVTYEEGPGVTSCVVNRAVVYKHERLEYKDYQAMVTRCPDREGGTPTLSEGDWHKCEQPDIEHPEQSKPVSSPRSGLTYRNMFCARCHNDSQSLDPWLATVTCASSAGPLISGSQTKQDLYSKLVNRTSVELTSCELKYTFPSSKDLDKSQTLDGTYKRFCKKVSPPLIDSCNASGTAGFRDPDIEQACALYESVFDGKYRNIFCFLCNEPRPYRLEELQQLVTTDSLIKVGRFDFAALLDFSGQVEGDPVEVDQCNITQFLDVATCECREVQCSEGKYLDRVGTCHSLIETNMLGYKACHKLDISANSPISEEDMDILKFSSAMVVPKYAKEHTTHVLQFCPNGVNISLYFEDMLSVYGTLEDLEERIRVVRDIYLSLANNTLGSALSSRVTITYPCLEGLKPEDQCSSNPSFSIDKSRMVGPILDNARTDIYYIKYSQTSACPFVSVSTANFTMVENGEKLLYKPTGNLLSAALVSFMDSPDTGSGSVRVCVSDYTELAKNSSCQDQQVDLDTWTVSGLISLICTVISLVCLALTFGVYSILAPLRVGGGRNIMVLTVLLFIAQALYEFGLEQFEHRDVCRALGLAIHYFWLATVFSMNACTVERFLKLCFPLKSRSFFLSERRPFMFATGYSLLCPLVIVSSNVATNITTGGGVGYGSHMMCYINSRMSRIIAFAVPMATVLLTNVVLLSVTMWTLRRRSEAIGSSGESSRNGSQGTAQTTKNSKVGLVGCARLSVVTGISWLLIFVYEALPSTALSYVITALIGLQGLVFFCSLVLNKRVLRMLRKAAESSSFSSTTSSGAAASKTTPHKKHGASNTATEQYTDSKVSKAVNEPLLRSNEENKTVH